MLPNTLRPSRVRVRAKPDSHHNDQVDDLLNRTQALDYDAYLAIGYEQEARAVEDFVRRHAYTGPRSL